jgi:hypothetical protein
MVDFDQGLITLFAATRWHAPAQRASGANSVPNTRADTRGPGTGPTPAAPKPTEPSGPIGTARASDCIHPDLPRGGNAPDQLNRVMSERGSERGSTSRINSATAYSNVNRDASTMAAGSHGDHAPISIELGRSCRPSGTDDCESHRESEGAHNTIANHESPHRCVVLNSLNAPFDVGWVLVVRLSALAFPPQRACPFASAPHRAPWRVPLLAYSLSTLP